MSTKAEHIVAFNEARGKEVWAVAVELQKEVLKLRERLKEVGDALSESQGENEGLREENAELVRVLRELRDDGSMRGRLLAIISAAIGRAE